MLKLLIGLVREGKLHAKEKRDGKSENKGGATEEIPNKMSRKRQTGDRWKVSTIVRGGGEKCGSKDRNSNYRIWIWAKQ